MIEIIGFYRIPGDTGAALVPACTGDVLLGLHRETLILRWPPS